MLRTILFIVSSGMFLAQWTRATRPRTARPSRRTQRSSVTRKSARAIRKIQRRKLTTLGASITAQVSQLLSPRSSTQKFSLFLSWGDFSHSLTQNPYALLYMRPLDLGWLSIGPEISPKNNLHRSKLHQTPWTWGSLIHQQLNVTSRVEKSRKGKSTFRCCLWKKSCYLVFAMVRLWSHSCSGWPKRIKTLFVCYWGPHLGLMLKQKKGVTLVWVSSCPSQWQTSKRFADHAAWPAVCLTFSALLSKASSMWLTFMSLTRPRGSGGCPLSGRPGTELIRSEPSPQLSSSLWQRGRRHAWPQKIGPPVLSQWHAQVLQHMSEILLQPSPPECTK